MFSTLLLHATCDSPGYTGSVKDSKSDWWHLVMIPVVIFAARARKSHIATFLARRLVHGSVRNFSEKKTKQLTVNRQEASQ